MKLDLTKSAGALRLSLEKAGIVTAPKVDLAFNLDVSGSFDDEHRGGLTQKLLSRMVPWGMVFDPNEQLDVFTFSNGERNAFHVGTINEHTHDGYIASKIIDKVPGYNGRTDYSYVIEKNLAHFAGKRSIVVHVTDGDNDDKDRTRRVLSESEARKDPVYFLFIGVSNQGSKFPFLESIGDDYGNTGLVTIKDLEKFVSQDDEQLNELLLGQELLEWLKA
jgi:hypothetical protein